MTLAALRRAFSPRRNRAVLRRIVADRRGVAAIEFAMLMPVMVVIYFGIVQVAQGVMVDRKVTQLNRAVADLTAQSGSLTTNDMTTIFDAALSVMAPYAPANARMMVASIVVDAAGIAKVCWSDQRNSAELSRGASVTLPTDLRVASSSVIMAQVSYDFTPVIGSLLPNTAIRIGDKPIYMRPRAGKTSAATPIEQVERTGKASPNTPTC